MATQTETYLRALAAAKQASGKDRGAAVWLAKYLDTDRQTLFYWSKAGFPLGKVAKVAELIGIPAKDVQEHTLRIPVSAWEELCKRNKRLTGQAIILK